VTGEVSLLFGSFPINVTVPAYVPSGSPLAAEIVTVLVVPLEPPEPAFLMSPLAEETDSQLPPLVVDAVAIHVSSEYGAPVSVTVTAWLSADDVREAEPGLTCISALGDQRMVKVALGIEGVNVCDPPSGMVYAKATVLNMFSKESPTDESTPLLFFSAMGVRSMEWREYEGTVVVAKTRLYTSLLAGSPRYVCRLPEHGMLCHRLLPSVAQTVPLATFPVKSHSAFTGIDVFIAFSEMTVMVPRAEGGVEVDELGMPTTNGMDVEVVSPKDVT
jgi:hypothetical protein